MDIVTYLLAKKKGSSSSGSGTVEPEEEYLPGYAPDGCLTFSSPEPFSITVSNPGWDGAIAYSANARSWNAWDGSEISAVPSSQSQVANDDLYYLYLWGVRGTKITGETGHAWTITGNKVRCDGNIETLLDYPTVLRGAHPSMAEGCYYEMFRDCQTLTSCPELPAVDLTKECYRGMFHTCMSLRKAPELPATVMADSCYAWMFVDCKHLIDPPALPATTLAPRCYESMFRRCSLLATVAALPATDLPDECYAAMYFNCYNIILTEYSGLLYYDQPYRVPITGEGVDSKGSALNSMIMNTGGTFLTEPNVTRYLFDTCSIK